ncbi:carboxylesterase/lipase family protein [Paenibacillus albidus]|uniref:carboxylesterase/lipase family protein n=1 Tax=Paenibacillus albidus TaxID=2041023 RepID=UPI001BEA3C67|nr:carboxylesterase/lipase family protein [Paenibacillus albidus]MBT2290783.1 carboxylesterase/lipase family protein [Paenibacillus albidus]
MEGTIITTAYGKVAGRVENGVNVWRGIPFAAPPVGALRFRAPQPPESWGTVREAFEFGPVSHQPADSRGTRFGGTRPQHSEDCLYLNIWSPAGGGEGLPVMVWIHGGTFVTGSGSQPLFDGSSLVARGNVIVVSINYRLGPFGFLHLSPLGEGFASNQGLLDQIAALQWVRGNIGAFGGDPQRVTVFGESAGSMSIAALLAMPAAEGLIAGAIMQSGAAQTLPPRQGEEIAAALLAELDVSPGGDRGLLNTLPAERILEAAERMTLKLTGGSLSMLFQPVIEPLSLPEDPAAAVAGGSAKGIPLLIGTNRDEGNLFFREGAPQADFEQSLKALEMLMGTGDLSDIAQHYPASWEGQAEILTDLYFWINSVSFAQNQLDHAPVWMYRFDWTSPGHPLLGKAVHGAEIAYVFNNLSVLQRLGVEITPAITRLSEAMQGAWLAFAHRGDPGTPELPWPPYQRKGRATLVFDGDSRIVHDPDPEKRRRLIRNMGNSL